MPLPATPGAALPVTWPPTCCTRTTDGIPPTTLDEDVLATFVPEWSGIIPPLPITPLLTTTVPAGGMPEGEGTPDGTAVAALCVVPAATTPPETPENPGLIGTGEGIEPDGWPLGHVTTDPGK